MGSIDTLELKTVLEDPPRLVLHSHQRAEDIVCRIDTDCASQLTDYLAEGEATCWLRSVSRAHNPFLGFWTRYSNYAILLRIKHGTARRDISIPCKHRTGKTLLAALNKEWSNAA